MTEALVVALLACVALAVVVAPLWRPRRDPGPRDARVEDATERRRAAFTALVDLEDERAIGKLSAADFDALRREYEAEALAALRELDALGSARDEDLEDEIARIRKEMECPSCGALRSPGEPCGRCGATA